MDEVSVVVSKASNLSGSDWWPEIDGESPLPLDASDGGLWSGNFVPPPPRPIFLDDSVTPDGLTTCDLCSWAWHNTNAFTLDAAMAPGEIGWVLTLVIVSLVSAVVGAIVMIIALHCRRIKNAGVNDAENGSNSLPNRRSIPLQSSLNPSSNKCISNYPNPIASNPSHTNSVWSWLSRRTTTAPPQLDPPPTSPAENHYTHMDETYGGVEEALYAELDRESTLDRDSNNAYQNSAYADPDAPPSTAPSSAYYSDLSVTTVPERAYEVVGLATMPIWDGSNGGGVEVVRRPAGRLAAISETVSVPSDYV